LERDETKRAQWRQDAQPWQANDLVFLDESGCNTTLHRLFGRSRRGKRCAGVVPRNWKENTTIIGALSLEGWQAMTLPGACDRFAFEAFVQEILVPSLRPGQIVILDNLSVHKSATARELIEEAGCQLVFRPPYSPDLNPIELMWSKVKAYLRKVAARTEEMLNQAITDALFQVSTQDTRSWFGYAGYH
jgi:transposase